MKYILFILAAIIVSLIALFVTQTGSGKPEATKNPAIVVNDRVITVDELAKIKQSYDEARPDLIESIIIKELMIQEAQKSGIDKEEQFRKSIQNFYEQSLIKTLIDRKLASLDIAVSDEEIDKHIAMMDKKLDLTLSKAASLDDLEQGKIREEKLSIPFSDLSGMMKNVVISLNKGEKSRPFIVGNEYVSVRLDNIMSGGRKPTDLSRDSVKKFIAEGKRERMMAEWIEDIRKKAKVKIHIGVLNGG